MNIHIFHYEIFPPSINGKVDKHLWYDGSSDLFEDFFFFFKPDILYVEDTVYDYFKDLAIKNNFDSSRIIRIHINDKSRKIEDVDTAFFHVHPSNETHAKSFLQAELFSEYLFPKFKDENAKEFLTQNGIKESKLEFEKSNGLIVGMDWDNYEFELISRFRKLNKPTFCLQESVLDFSIKRRRMLNADYALIQGIATASTLSHPVQMVVGNPRYKKGLSKLLKQKSIKVAINLNFSYGIGLEAGAIWLKQVVSTLQKLDLDYIILEHPRNELRLPGLKSVKTNAFTIDEHLVKCQILVSRFSSLLHEALHLGCRSIYHCALGEKMNYDFNCPGNLVAFTSDSDSLEKELLNLPSISNGNLRRYMNAHTGNTDGKANERLKRALSTAISNKHVLKVPFLYNLKRTIGILIARNRRDAQRLI